MREGIIAMLYQSYNSCDWYTIKWVFKRAAIYHEQGTNYLSEKPMILLPHPYREIIQLLHTYIQILITICDVIFNFYGLGRISYGCIDFFLILKMDF